MIISSKGFGIKILPEGVSDEILLKDVKNNPLLYKFIPNLNLDSDKYDLVLKIKNQEEKRFIFSLKESLIAGKYGQDFNSNDVIVLVEYLLERLRQEKGIYTLHSSSVYKDNIGLVLLGNLTGLGKTSTVLFLKEKFGFEIYSDEKCLINSNNNSLTGQTQKVFVETKTQNSL